MIALKQIECCEVLPLTMAGGGTRRSWWLNEGECDNAQVLEGPKPTLRIQESMTAEAKSKKGSGVLEERLLSVRKELEQRTKEHSRLLGLARQQADRLAALEPMPGLFLARIEGVLQLVEQRREESSSDESAITPDELDRRFNQAIAKLRLVLDRDHILENQELRETLTKIQSALAVKREEALGLQVEQEQLTQRLSAVLDTLKRFNVEAVSREERIAKLQRYVKESEARHHRLFVDRRSMKDRKVSGFGSFTFMTGGNGSVLKRRRRLSQIAPLIVGLILGCALTIAGDWFMHYNQLSWGILEWQPQSFDSVYKTGYGSAPTGQL